MQPLVDIVTMKVLVLAVLISCAVADNRRALEKFLIQLVNNDGKGQERLEPARVLDVDSNSVSLSNLDRLAENLDDVYLGHKGKGTLKVFFVENPQPTDKSSKRPFYDLGSLDFKYYPPVPKQQHKKQLLVPSSDDLKEDNLDNGEVQDLPVLKNPVFSHLRYSHKYNNNYNQD